MKGAICAVAAGAIFAAGIGRAETLLTISTVDPSLAGQPLVLDGKFVGVVGDTISIPATSTSLGVYLPQGFYATISIRVEGNILQATTPVGGECLKSTAWTIRGALAPKATGAAPRFALELPSLPLVAQGSCSSQPSSLSCTETAAQVEVKAIPEVHAAVWVAGKDTHTTTPGLVSYPYCVGMSPRMDFVLRKASYGNCAVDIRADGRTGPYSVQCTLTPLTK